MHSSVAISLIVHVVVIVVAIFGLPNPSEFEVEKTEAVPVEILTVSDLTRLQAQSKKAKPTEKIAPEKVEKKPEAPDPKPAIEQKKTAAVQAEATPKPAPEPAPTPKPEAVAPTPPPVREEKPKVEDKPEPKPLPKKAEPEPKPAEKAEPEPEPEPEVAAKPTPPKPKIKPKPPKRPKKVVKKKKPNDFNLDQISALLDKSEDKNQRKIEEAPGEDGSPTIGDVVSQIGADAQLTLDEEDALRQQIQKCWNPPVGVAGAEKLLIQLRIGLNEDGSVQSNPRLLNSVSHPSFQIAADSAIRAVLRCAPYDMPAEKYETWRDIKMNFDPSEMLN